MDSVNVYRPWIIATNMCVENIRQIQINTLLEVNLSMKNTPRRKTSQRSPGVKLVTIAWMLCSMRTCMHCDVCINYQVVTRTPGWLIGRHRDAVGGGFSGWRRWCRPDGVSPRDEVVRHMTTIAKYTSAAADAQVDLLLPVNGEVTWPGVAWEHVQSRACAKTVHTHLIDRCVTTWHMVARETGWLLPILRARPLAQTFCFSRELSGWVHSLIQLFAPVNLIRIKHKITSS